MQYNIRTRCSRTKRFNIRSAFELIFMRCEQKIRATLTLQNKLVAVVGFRINFVGGYRDHETGASVNNNNYARRAAAKDKKNIIQYNA